MTFVKLALKRTVSPALRRFGLLVAVCGLAGATPAGSQTGQAQQLPGVELRLGMHRIWAQVAQTDAQRALGLMNRREMPQHHGMVFVFPEAQKHCFWMRNTLMPLSIAFIDDSGRIVSMAEMRALDDKTNHCAAEPVRFALEMNQGWFAKRGVQVGQQLEGTLFQRAPRTP